MKQEKDKNGAAAITRRQALGVAGSAALPLLVPSNAFSARSRATDRTRASVEKGLKWVARTQSKICLLYTSPSPRDS